MAPHLSKEDVARLLKEPSPLVRAEVAGKLAADIDDVALSESELGLAQEVVRLMAKDVESTVRQALSESLRKSKNIPHDIALQLANDVESVALPILESSSVLTEADLISVINAGSSQKHQAIAKRPGVTEIVADALIVKADEVAVSTLMKNKTAKISEESLTKAVTRFEDSDVVKESMVLRDKLPIIVAERLTAIVSDRLKTYLVAHHDLPDSVASDLVLQSRERTVVGLSVAGSSQDIEYLVQQMFEQKRLTPSLVLRALCMGDVRLFEAALAIMANVPLINARILIHDAGRLGFKTLYEKASMPPRLLPAARAALEVVHETEMDGEPHDLERYKAKVIERVLTQLEDFSPEDVDYLIAKLGDVLLVTQTAEKQEA